MSKARTARQVIDQAIQENKASERLLYVFASAFATVGIGILVLGAIKGQQLTAIAGSISAILFWPAMRLARQTRRESIAIRLLEAPLAMAETSQQAAETIQRLVESILNDSLPLPSRETQHSEVAPRETKRVPAVEGAATDA